LNFEFPEISLNNEISLTKSGYVELPRDMYPHQSTGVPEPVAISLSTNDPNGILFYHGQSESTDGAGGDHFAIALVDGYVRVTYELGSGMANITWKKYPIADGKNHKIKVVRTGRVATVQVDEGDVVYGESGGILRLLNAKGNVFVGKYK
jgi:hypothetical protein